MEKLFGTLPLLQGYILFKFLLLRNIILIFFVLEINFILESEWFWQDHSDKPIGTLTCCTGNENETWKLEFRVSFHINNTTANQGCVSRSCGQSQMKEVISTDCVWYDVRRRSSRIVRLTSWVVLYLSMSFVHWSGPGLWNHCIGYCSLCCLPILLISSD